MIDWSTVPNPSMVDGLRRYYERGDLPGSFLRSLLENDFKRTVMGADDENFGMLLTWARWLHNEFDSRACGSPQAVLDWCSHGGQPGREAWLVGRARDAAQKRRA